MQHRAHFLALTVAALMMPGCSPEAPTKGQESNSEGKTSTPERAKASEPPKTEKKKGPETFVRYARCGQLTSPADIFHGRRTETVEVQLVLRKMPLIFHPSETGWFCLLGTVPQSKFESVEKVGQIEGGNIITWKRHKKLKVGTDAKPFEQTLLLGSKALSQQLKDAYESLLKSKGIPQSEMPARCAEIGKTKPEVDDTTEIEALIETWMREGSAPVRGNLVPRRYKLLNHKCEGFW